LFDSLKVWENVAFRLRRKMGRDEAYALADEKLRRVGLVAETAATLPLELAETYRLTSPPITHNVLVNMGLRPRGLCTHFAEDLLRRLDALELKTLDLYWAVAFPTKPFRLEHSAALVSAQGRGFESGIVLDAWRDSGELFFAPVTEDTRYAWQRLYNNITDPPPPDRTEPVPPESLYD
ncbi:MAG: hypothetical protein AAFU65_00115, partial [Pseudomonadota bacterium]